MRRSTARGHAGGQSIFRQGRRMGSDTRIGPPRGPPLRNLFRAASSRERMRLTYSARKKLYFSMPYTSLGRLCTALGGARPLPCPSGIGTARTPDTARPYPRIRSAQPINQRGDRPFQFRPINGRKITVNFDLKPANPGGAFHLPC